MKRLFTVLILWSLASEVRSGENLHAYNEARDKAAQQIATAYTNISLLGIITLQYTNLAAIATQEMASLDAQNSTLRDLELFALLSSTNGASVSFFTNSLAHRLEELVGANVNVETLGATAENLAIQMEQIEIGADQFRAQIHASPPNFTYAERLPRTPPASLTNQLATGVTPEDVTSAYQRYLQTCDTASDTLTNLSGTALLEAAFGQLISTSTALDSEQKDAQTLLKNYQKAAADYETELKNGTSSTRINYQTVAQDLQKATSAMENATNLLANQAALNAKLGAVREIIAAAAGSTNQDASVTNSQLKTFIAVATGIPSTVEGSAKLQDAFKMPEASGLLLTKELLLIKKETLDQQLLYAAQRRQAYESKFKAILLEIHFLHQAQQLQRQINSETDVTDAQRTNVFKGTNYAELPVMKLLSSNSTPSIRRDMNQAILLYCNSIRVARMRQDSADYALAHIDYLDANLANESSVRMWNSLIAIPVNQLVAYHGSGFKPAEVADIVVKGLGFGAIAWRLK